MSQVPRAVHAFCNALRYCIWLWSACSYMPMQQTTYSTSNFSELSKSNCFWASEVKERRRWWHPFCRLCLRMLRDWWSLPCPQCFVTWSLCVVMFVQPPSSWLSASHHCDKDFIIFIYLHWSLLSWIMNALLKNTNSDLCIAVRKWDYVRLLFGEDARLCLTHFLNSPGRYFRVPLPRLSKSRLDVTDIAKMWPIATHWRTTASLLLFAGVHIQMRSCCWHWLQFLTDHGCCSLVIIDMAAWLF